MRRCHWATSVVTALGAAALLVPLTAASAVAVRSPSATPIDPSTLSAVAPLWSVSAMSPLNAPAPAATATEVFSTCRQGLCAYRATSGGLIWSRPVPAGATVVSLSTTRHFLIVGFQGSGSVAGVVSALSLSTGRPKWAVAVEGSQLSWAKAFPNGLVYFDNGAVLAAVTAAGGTPVWSKDFTATSGPGSLQGGTLYEVQSSGALFALDALDGKTLWTGQFPGEGLDDIGPTIAGHRAYVSEYDEFPQTSNPQMTNLPAAPQPDLFGFRLQGCGRATCEPVFTTALPSTPELAEGRRGVGLVEVGPKLMAMSMVSGQLLLTYGDGAAGALDGTPVYSHGLLFSGTFNGAVVAFSTTPCGALSCPAKWTRYLEPSLGATPVELTRAGQVLYAMAPGGLLVAFGVPGPGRHTAPPGAPTDVSYRNGVVSWHPPSTSGSQPLVGYLISSPGDPSAAFADPTATSAGFTPAGGHHQVVDVEALSPAGNATGASSPFSSFTAPGSVAYLGVVPQQSSAVVEWLPPTSDGGSPLRNYTVTVQSTSGQRLPSVTVPGTAHDATVNGLSPDTTYTASVTAVTDHGSTTSSASPSFTAGGTPVPNPPLPVLRSGPPMITWHRHATFAVRSVPGDGVTFECAFQEGPSRHFGAPSSCPRSASFSGLGPGMHVLAIWAVSNGQRSYEPSVWAWTVAARP